MIDNLTTERPTFVTHLECGLTGERHEADKLWNLSRGAGKPLLVKYDLAGIKKAVSKSDLEARTADLWRYREFLPVRKVENIVSLGEPMTPLITAPRSAKASGGTGVLLVKDEGRLPTGSFKARGLAMAVSKAKELGVTRMAMPTAGNAGGALAAYCARAGIEAYVFYPEDAPPITVGEIPLFGGHGYAVNGLITDCGPIVEKGIGPAQWFSTATFKEPYRVEGKKTMGLELAEQLNWELPDVIVYPTGGGTGLLGMWKAFAEMEAIGWIGSKRPRMVAVQATNCQPIVRAFEQGTQFAEPWANASTNVPGIRVPATIGDFLILNVIRESGGFAMAVEDADTEQARSDMAKADGINLCPEGAATYAAYRQSLASGRIGKNDRVVLFNCGSGLKCPTDFVPVPLDRHKPIDYAKFLSR